MSRPIQLSEIKVGKDLFPEENSHGEIRTNCLFCEDDNKHMYANIDKGLYHCFKCGASGRILRRREDKYGILDAMDKRLLKKVDKSNIEEKEVRSLPRNRSSLPVGFGERGEIRKFLRVDRGLTPEEISNNDLRESLDRTGIFSNSVIFPVPAAPSPLRYFTCRKIAPLPYESKYVNAPWPKSNTVYEPWTSKLGKYTFTICEGPFDAIRVARVAPSFALLGKRANKEQLDWLANRLNRAIILLDPEAYTDALRLKLELSSKGVKTVIAQLTRTDPGASTEEEIKEVLENAHLQLSS